MACREICVNIIDLMLGITDVELCDWNIHSEIKNTFNKKIIQVDINYSKIIYS